MAVPKVDGQFIAEAIKYIDENGLFSNDWSGNRKEQFKSLLENA